MLDVLNPLIGELKTNRGSKLTTGQTLTGGDYLQSENECFILLLQEDGDLVLFQRSLLYGNWRPRWHPGYTPPGVNQGPYTAVMQEDGNFVIYRPNAVVWATYVIPGANQGPYTAVLQDDRNFVIYRPNAVVWATYTSWYVSGIGVSNVTYDLDHATIGNPTIQSSVYQYLENQTSVEQSETFNFTCQYTETQSWSTTSSVTRGASLSITAPIPGIGNGQVQLSGQEQRSTTNGGQSTQTKTYTDNIPVRVPPHSKVTCKAVASTANIVVPYSGDAVYAIFEYSGFIPQPDEVIGKIEGTYNGSSAYQLQATWEEQA